MKTRKREESLSTTLCWFVLVSDGKGLWPSALGHPETKTSEAELSLQICEDDTLFTPTEFNPKLPCEISEITPEEMFLVSRARVASASLPHSKALQTLQLDAREASSKWDQTHPNPASLARAVSSPGCQSPVVPPEFQQLSNIMAEKLK